MLFLGEDMRKAQKQEILEMIQTLHQAHDEIKNNIDRKNFVLAQDVLSQCQECAISIGTAIENLEGKGFITISFAEAYCDVLFSAYERLNGKEANANKIYKNLRKQLLRIENSVKNDVPIRKEAVFLPYKASMWDSLESIWKAADADPDCDAYVIPIPYYDKNPDGSFREMHYEGDQYPDDVPITKYDEFDFGKHHPDMIFIHNPYDDCNTVTSVHPFFFSDKMKKCTDCLVYVPYFATAGGMNEGQALCPAYINADYIVIQSEKYRKYYDPRLPDEKFLALGSPKFDSVIRKCQNLPEPPTEWKAKMTKADGTRKKVYFYNTSIGGMLNDTLAFLKKMQYVFDNFKGRDDVCILWRPHPLLESTFDSMRPQYKPIYEAIKQEFIESGLGIYDTTPHIEDTIAVCDAYIGDSGTSVTSLFGVVGKPMFILNNNIHTLPAEDDWKGTVYQVPFQTLDGVYHNKYCVTQGNKLYYSPNDDMHYEYLCDLSEYAGGGYYNRAFDYGDKIYVFPNNAQHILAVSQNKTIRKIELKNEVEQSGVFSGFWIYGDYAFLLPNRYPALVRFNMKTEEIMYLTGVGQFNVAEINTERIPAANWINNDKMYFMNPTGTQLLGVDMETLETEVTSLNFNRLFYGAGRKEIKSDDLWLLPYEGTTVTHWNIVTGETKDYDLTVEGIKSMHRGYKNECNQRMFGSMAFVDDEIIFSPAWGNKFVKLNPYTGKAEEWESPFNTSAEDISQYIPNWGIGGFIYDVNNTEKCSFMLSSERKTYDIDLHTKEIKEVEMSFEKEEVYRHADGYGKESQWIQYCCVENVFNSVADELGGNIHGETFDREKQIKEFSQINASPDGDCGEKIYRYVTKNME